LFDAGGCVGVGIYDGPDRDSLYIRGLRIRVNDSKGGKLREEANGEDRGFCFRFVAPTLLCLQWLENRCNHHTWRFRVGASGSGHSHGLCRENSWHLRRRHVLQDPRQRISHTWLSHEHQRPR